MHYQYMSLIPGNSSTAVKLSESSSISSEGCFVGFFCMRTNVASRFRCVLHLSQVSLFGQPVSVPQLRHGNSFSLTTTDYHLLWLTKENLIQIKRHVYLIYCNHYLGHLIAHQRLFFSDTPPSSTHF